MPDPPRDIGPIPDGSSADVHPDRDDPVIESEATETQPSSDEESEETDRPETDKTPEAKVADERQAAPTETSKELEDENAKAARAETGKAPEAKVADENQGAQTDTSKGLKDGKAEAAPAETGRTPEVKLTDLTEAVGTETSKEPEGTKHDSATAKTATEIGKGAEPKLSGKENTADGKAGQPPIPPKKKAPPGWPIIDCSQSSAELDKKLTDCMTALYGETLVQDVEGAQMLLSFVTRNGLQEDKKIDNATIQKLVETRERMRAGTFDAEKEEVDFRKSYGIVAKAADPVNVASLRESTDKQVRHPWLHPWTKQLHSTAGNACLKYRNLAFLVLIALLICQIYWTILSSVLNKTDALSDEINKAPTNAEYDQLEAVRQKTATVTNQPETNKPGPPPTVPAQASPTPTPQLTLEERNAKTAERDANFLTLRGLVNPMAYVFFRQVLPTLFPAADKDKGKQPPGPPVKPEPSAKTSGPSVPSPDKDQSNPLKEQPVRNDGAKFIPTDIQNQRATVRAVAVQVIDVMQKWVLPLLYGMLGAMVFVVRTLSMQARDRLFRKEALVALSLRVYLGMISGLAIGWFWTASPPVSGPAGAVSITTLSPFALAFVAGYGVDLFFSLLDKIVSAFSNKT